MAANTVAAGCLGCGLMGVIYLAVAVVGAQSRGLYPASSNGGEALLAIRAALFRRLRGGDPGGDRHLCLRQDGGGPHHQLLPDLLRAVPPWAVLPDVGGGVLPVLLWGGQLGLETILGLGHPPS